MCEQVGRHEGPVRVTTHGNPIGISHSSSNNFIDSRSSACDELFDVGIVRFNALALTDDWQSRAVENSVPAGEPDQRALRADTGEAIRRVSEL